jgi:hypothetical protein
MEKDVNNNKFLCSVLGCCFSFRLFFLFLSWLLINPFSTFKRLDEVCSKECKTGPVIG